MSGQSPRVAALVIVDPVENGLGLPSRFDRQLGPMTVLDWLVQRLNQARHVNAIVLISPDGQPGPSLDPRVSAEKVTCLSASGPLRPADHGARVAARKWAPAAWRGGLGGLTCYDEQLHAELMVEALDAVEASAGLIVSADWPLVDPALCDAVIERHATHPDELKTTFTQAPPGLCGFLVARTLLADMARDRATLGHLLEYRPAYPQPDPIALHACVQVSPAVRDCPVRLTVDAPRWARIVEHVVQRVLDELPGTCDSADPALLAGHRLLNAESIVNTARRFARDHPPDLPQTIAVELTTRRPANGPITPQHHVDLSRDDLTRETACRLFEQFAEQPDTAIMFAGLGDALMHEGWLDMIQAARDAGAWGVGLQTDLQVDQPTLEKLVEAPLDLIVIDLNADTPQTYERLMGGDALDVIRNRIQWLLTHRRTGQGLARPWIVPRMVKTRDNVSELEPFFDRWMHFAGYAVVTGPTIGGGLMPEQAVIDMAPPTRFACRQLARRMTILSSGRVAMCDQDWAGDHAIGRIDDKSISEQWKHLCSIERDHQAGNWDGYALCCTCRQWHRP